MIDGENDELMEESEEGEEDEELQETLAVLTDLYVNGINADEDEDNADWTKQSWDFPEEIQNAEEFREFLGGLRIDPEHFKKLPVYRMNADKIPWLKDL